MENFTKTREGADEAEVYSADNGHELSEPLDILGWKIKFLNKNKDDELMFQIDKKEKQIIARCDSKEDFEVMKKRAVLSVAREIALDEMITGINPDKALEFFSEDRNLVSELLKLTGSRILREREPQVAEMMANSLPSVRSCVSEFRTACALYLLTGNFPQTTQDVKTEIDRLPISKKTNEHILHAITDPAVSLYRKKDYFDRFLAPAIERLKKLDAEIGESTSESFKPFTDDLERQELKEKDILQKVYPYLGGYYREKVMDAVDWQSMSLVATSVPSSNLVSEERIKEEDTKERKRHTFSGINGADFKNGEITTPLPASAIVLPETITDKVKVRQTINGAHTLLWGGEGEPPENYQFEFEIGEEIPNWRRAKPREEEIIFDENVFNTFSKETQQFIEGLKNARITDSAKVGQIARFVQKNIEYVNDSEVGDALKMAGAGYFRELEKTKKGDCKVSNFYALAMIRACGIPCRMITGYHVSKDKRFNFAVLAGIGHAWLEWWDEKNGLWERIDATPPKKEDDEEKEEEEKGKKSGNAGRKMKITDEENPETEPDDSDNDPFDVPFSDDDLENLRQKLSEIQSDQREGGNDLNRIFEEIHGASKEEWEKIRREVEEIGKRIVPRENTIEKRANSTIEKEWQKIFQLLLIAYRRHLPINRLIGKESQGGILVDPVSAFTDIAIGAEDPYGFSKLQKRQVEEKLPIRFSNDFLLDLTSSMEAKNNEGQSLIEMERQFVMSGLFQEFELNESVKGRANILRDVPLIISHILSIHGGNKWKEILKNRPISLKDLVVINSDLRKTTKGAGAMADAIEEYVETLEKDIATVEALKKGEMAKTLTIITDGNLWCSRCGAESCNFELHGPSLARVKTALNRARELGVKINAIGFTENSRPVAELFKDEKDPLSAVVVENLDEALLAHYKQVLRTMTPILESAKRALLKDLK